MRLRPRGHDFELPTVKFELINETLLSILYFNTYDCVYTDLVLSGCVVIFKIFLLRFIV